MFSESRATHVLEIILWPTSKYLTCACGWIQTGYIETAVKGTLNVLESCAKLKRPLKRLVLTSSMAAVHFSKKLTPDSVIDETFFSDPEVIRNLPFLVSTHPSLTRNS